MKKYSLTIWVSLRTFKLLTVVFVIQKHTLSIRYQFAHRCCQNRKGEIYFSGMKIGKKKDKIFPSNEKIG